MPYERSLVTKWEGRQFALLGVNTDPDRNQIQQVSTEKQINWRSWWDGGTSGPIVKRWGVEGFPTVFVIDGRGVIRYRDVKGAELEKAVEKLLGEL